MNRGHLDIEAGATFLMVARTGSVRKAAERLHRAPSAVSRQVVRLERDLGETLLDRRSDGVALTAAGEIFQTHMIDLLRRIDLMRDALSSEQGSSGVVRLATVEGITRDFLSPQIVRFARQRAALTFSVDVRSRDKVFDALEQYEAELGFVYDHFSHPGIETAGVWRQSLQAFAPAGHRLANGQPLTVGDLDGARCVLPDDSFGIHRLVRRAFARAGAAPDVRLQSNHLHFLVAHALRTQAIVFAPVRAVQAEVIVGKLVPLNLDCPAFEHRFISAVVRRETPMTTGAAEFLEQIIASFAQSEGEDEAIIAEARRQAWSFQP